MSFVTENELVRSFGQLVQSKRTSLPQMEVSYEFLFMGGKTDIVGVTAAETVHSFEAKLKRWRDCLYQAYRNTSFSHYSYVLVPVNVAESAMREEEQFRRRGVGLCSIEGQRVRLHIRPRRQSPLQPWFTERAVAAAGRTRNG